MNTPNPLLTFTYQFDFSALNPEHVEPGIAELIERSKGKIQKIIDLQGERTFENTIAALETATEDLGFAYAILNHIESVATTPEFRVVYNKIQVPISEFYSSISLNAALFSAVKAYASSEAVATLSPPRARLVEQTLKSFKRNGAELDAAGKKRIAEIDAELSEITNRYNQNALDSTNEFEWYTTDEKSLLGLPENAIAAAKQSATEKGKSGYRFTLQVPSYRAILTYHTDEKVREHFYRAFNNRASEGKFNNSELVLRILALRRERATLLGFANFADLTTEDRMARSGARARQFLEEMVPVVRVRFDKELEELQKFRYELEGANAPRVRAWDIPFYSEKLRKKVCNHDPEALRPYFSFERALEGLFEVSKRLYGLQFEQVGGFPIWDKEVRTFAVRDRDGTLIGNFFADYFPRESKRSGAWMESLVVGVQGRKGRDLGLGFMGGNFTPPLNGVPALLTHEEVCTLFHEAGHLLHGLLSKVELASQGINGVAWDFIELPSQFFENWCWKREAIDLLAKHYQTGEKLPEEQFQAMVRAKNFQRGLFYLRQLGFGILDLSLHTEYDPKVHGDVVAYARTMLAKFLPEVPSDSAFVNSFGHIFGGPVVYASGYYSYLWAEVLEADAFSRFEKEGIFNAKVGAEFRTKILEKGDTERPEVLFESFMGRPPKPDALLKRAGL